MDDMALTEANPAEIAGMLLADELDLGLVPVAIIPLLKEWHLVSNYCIAADGEVASVALFSKVPMEKITTVLLDNQSRTSVNLAKILLEEHWKRKVVFEETTGDYRSKINGTTAGVVIGDRALEQRLVSPYVYDLGLGWKQYTGLPFVFAAWVSNKPLGQGFETDFNQANGVGLQELDAVIAENAYLKYDLRTYYTQNIAYQLDDEKRKGLDLFLEKIKRLT